MLKAFKQIPDPLQKQILDRLKYGAGLVFVTIALLYYTMELYSVLACVIIALFFAVSAFLLFRRAVIGDYVVIKGECLSVTLTPIKKRIKMITLRTEDNQTLKVMIKHRLKKIAAGSQITLYVAPNMTIYENGDAHMLFSYIALAAK